MSHRPRLALASLALAASLAAAPLPAQAAPRGSGSDLFDRVSGLLERAWSALLDRARVATQWEKAGPCPDPNGQPNPSCTPVSASQSDRTGAGPTSDPRG